MKTETTEEFLARGGKILKSSDKNISLEELLIKEGLDKDLKNASTELKDSISKSLASELKSKQA